MSKIRPILGICHCRYNNVRLITTKVPIISCKRSEFNHYKGQTYSKFEGVKLASKGWLHQKSKGDYFIIQGEKIKREDLFEKSSFEKIGVSKELIEVMSTQGINIPTRIQAKAIPAMLNGFNTIITAETGCGKTLAYLLPIFQHILNWKPHLEKEEFNSPLAIIITPSRELAQQVGDVAQALGETLNLNIAKLIGGRTKRNMLNPPIEYTDVLVATLGAFSKMLTNCIYKTHNVHHVVLDEADTLLDNTFIEKLSHVLHRFPIYHKTNISTKPTGCQLTMVSATMPVELPETVSSFVDAESVKVIATNKIHKPMFHVPQKFMRLGKAQKPLELLKLVKSDVHLKRPVMIFSNKISTCDFVSMFLNENNVECVNINGNMTVALKEGKFEMFKSGQVNVLSCTDISARGLDTIHVQHVVNYDFPLHTAEYIHRCGRTGRVGSPENCNITNFVAWPREIEIVQKIESSVRQDKILPRVDGNISKVIENRITNQLHKQVSAMTV